MTDILGKLTSALAERYAIERELGAGGMATVYLAHDVRHDRKVALKVLRPELSAILGGERFLAEIKTTANLQHPHILSLFDSGEADGLVFYVMPYVEGESLRERLTREKQLPVEEAVRIAREVADALEYAHTRGVVHRDIKPENVMLAGGHALVADFGIALAASRTGGGTRLTETGMSLGTPHYMAPEQAMGEREITPRADIYALGCVLYEMLTAEPPFTGATAQAIIARVMTEEPRPLAAQRRTIPPHVEAAVQRALAKLPADRFVSAADFAAALVNPQFAGIAAQPPAATRLRRVPAAVWAALAAAFALGAWGWLRPAPPQPMVRYVLTLADSGQLGQASGSRVAISPDGSVIVYVGTGSHGTGNRLWLQRRDALGATPLAGTEGGYNPAFSPDGSKIAFVAGAPLELKTMSLGGGAPLVLTDSLVDAGGVSWGSDGFIYYDGHLAGDGLARIRETGGSPEIFTTPRADSGESYHNAPDALPDGRGVLFQVRRGGTASFDIGVADPRGRHTILAHGMWPRYLDGHVLWVTPEGSLMAARFSVRRLRLTGQPRKIADGVAIRVGPGADVAVSREGTLLYVAGSAAGSAGELVWVSRTGGATSVNPAWTGAFTRPTISPDGQRAAVVMDHGVVADLWVTPLAGGPASKLTFEGRVLSQAWWPDGRRIVYSAVGGAAGPTRVFTVPFDGSALPSRFMPDTEAMTGIEVSRDGRWILFNRAGAVMAARVGDTTRLTLLKGQHVTLNPALSPDGRWLAYMSSESGPYEIYVRPFPATGTAKRQISTDGGVLPRWDPSGRELYYQSNLKLMAVSVLPGVAFAAGQPRPLFSLEGYVGPVNGTAWYDVGAGGRRFLMVRRLGTQSTQDLVVVEHAAALLTAGGHR